MKTILYVGAALMIGASIYGFVDYKKTSRQKEFKKMYDSQETVSPIVDKEKTVDLKDQPVKKSDIVETKSETIKSDKASVNASLKENTATKTDEKEKKVLNYKLFSRAPLEKKYIEKELKIEPVKTVQTGTLEKNKEQ